MRRIIVVTDKKVTKAHVLSDELEFPAIIGANFYGMKRFLLRTRSTDSYDWYDAQELTKAGGKTIQKALEAGLDLGYSDFNQFSTAKELYVWLAS